VHADVSSRHSSVARSRADSGGFGCNLHRNSVVDRLRARVSFELRQIIPLVSQALAHVESGPMGFHDMEFIRAAAPAA
jgi:hypothetical protein